VVDVEEPHAYQNENDKEENDLEGDLPLQFEFLIFCHGGLRGSEVWGISNGLDSGAILADDFGEERLAFLVGCLSGDGHRSVFEIHEYVQLVEELGVLLVEPREHEVRGIVVY